MADSLNYVSAVLRAHAGSAEAAASFYALLGVSPRRKQPPRPRFPSAADRQKLADEGRAEILLLAVHLSVAKPGQPLPPHHNAAAAFRRAARWLLCRPPRTFASWRRGGGQAEVLIEVQALSEQHGPNEWLPQEFEVPTEFLAACGKARLPVVLGAFGL